MIRLAFNIREALQVWTDANGRLRTYDELVYILQRHECLLEGGDRREKYKLDDDKDLVGANLHGLIRSDERYADSTLFLQRETESPSSFND
jgi:hypothetical protein